MMLQFEIHILKINPTFKNVSSKTKCSAKLTTISVIHCLLHDIIFPLPDNMIDSLVNTVGVSIMWEWVGRPTSENEDPIAKKAHRKYFGNDYQFQQAFCLLLAIISMSKLSPNSSLAGLS